MSYVRVTNLDSSLRPVGQGVVAEELAVEGDVETPAALDSRVKFCLVSVKTAAVYVTFDGTDPVAGSAGVLLPAGYLEVWGRRRVEESRWISAGSAVVRLEPLSE